MLSLEDCVALSCLTEEEIEAIAEHEHLPTIVAAELGSYLVQSPDGTRYIRSMIQDDIKAANERNNLVHALALKLVLRHYLATHPECAGVAGSLTTKDEEAIRRVLSRMPPHCA